MRLKTLTEVNVMVKMMVVLMTLCPRLTLSDSQHLPQYQPPPPQPRPSQPLHPRDVRLQGPDHHHQQQDHRHASPPFPNTLHHHHHHQGQHHQGRPLDGAQQQQVINTTELYDFCLNFSGRFQAHVSLQPTHMSLEDLKPHLWMLFKELDFLAFVSQFVESHVGAITTAQDVRALYNLLDLYSALEDLRQKYLQKVMERLVTLSGYNTGLPGRLVNPLVHLILGFGRHINHIRRNMTALYRSALEPSVNNVQFVARYQPHSLPKLDRMMANLSLPSPFLNMDGEGYTLRPADHPHYLITVQRSGDLWRLAATTPATPVPSSVFSFKPVRGDYGAVQYVLSSALLPATYHLVIPPGPGGHAAKRKDILYFDTQEGGALDVIKLPGEEHVLVHKIKGIRDQVLFLYWRTQDTQVGLTSSYPGREAHWLFQDTTTATPGPPQRLTDEQTTET